MDKTFDPQTLAEDLAEVSRIYARFFAGLDEASWDRPVKGGPQEWTLHETIAHLSAFHGAGLESMQHALRGEPYTFEGFDSRYDLNAYNRQGINSLLGIPMEELFTRFLNIHAEIANIAKSLRPDQIGLTSKMAAYNRPVSIVESLGIVSFHAGLIHSAQAAEPAGVPPLWTQLSPEIRHRLIGRLMRAFSLLYRFDLGGSLQNSIAFRVGGPGGGEWYVKFSPDSASSGEDVIEHPGLVIQLRDTGMFCQMVTGRFSLPIGLVSGKMKLRGDLRLFLGMNTMFSVDARPKGVIPANTSLAPNRSSEVR